MSDVVVSSPSLTVSHKIPHKLMTKKLVAPAPCDHCGRFIWGIMKESVACAECQRNWHPGCEAHAAEDCGLSQFMVNEALQIDSAGLEVKRTNSKPVKKEKDVQFAHGHSFKQHSYKSPTWCNHCSSFIWGITKQGWKCQKCDLDCHSRCVPLAAPCLPLNGGQLLLADSSQQLDVLSSKQVQERRIANQKKHITFGKTGRFRVKKGSGALMAVLANSLMVTPTQLVSSDSPESSTPSLPETKEQAESSESEEEPGPLPVKPDLAPLNDDPMIKSALLAESFSETFSVGVQVRERRESQNDSTDKDLISEDEFAHVEMSDFEIDKDKVFGSGQFGVVKPAKHKASGTPLAVKIIDKRKFWGRKNSQRHLKREIAIMSSLKHPNIIQLRAVIDQPNELYLFMELGTSGDLLAHVEKKGYITEDEGKFLLHQLCVGVKYLHDMGVVHRDLKPENLLLCEEDGVKRLKIADFGFANIVGEKSFLKSVVGTPAYVAPEILKKSKGYQKSADMWSIGVIMYACLSGVFPFDDDEKVPVEVQIQNGKFSFPAEYWGKVSDAAIDLICKLLVVEPRDRYTANDALAHPWFSIRGPLKI